MSTKRYPKKQDEDALENTGIYDHEEEIDLLDYLRVIWNRKWFIMIASALPTLAVGLLLLLSPRTYTTTFVYDVKNYSETWPLTEKNFNVMVSRFYSQENLNNLSNTLKKNGLTNFGEKVRNSNAISKPLVGFKTEPEYIDISKIKISDQTDIQEFIDMEASLLRVTVSGKVKEDMSKISAIIRDNIENIIPLYTIQDQLEARIRSLKNKLGQMESNRYMIQLSLKENRQILDGLKKIQPIRAENSESNITIQYDIATKSEFLPLSYQVHAAESKIINLEQNILKTEAEYKYYTDLVKFNQNLLSSLSEKISGDYSMASFRSYLANLPKDIEKTELKEYLSSFAINIENWISASKPVSNTPGIYPVSRGTLKKCITVLLIASMISVFASFLLEGKKDIPRNNLSVKIP